MFEKELQAYLKEAAPALPCAEARSAFAAYVRGVAREVCGETTDADFSPVAVQLGSRPGQAARDFVDSQSPQTLARWNVAAHNRKFRLRLVVGLVIAVLASVILFFVATKGVMVVTRETTIINWGDTDMTPEEMLQKSLEITKPKEENQ